MVLSVSESGSSLNCTRSWLAPESFALFRERPPLWNLRSGQNLSWPTTKGLGTTDDKSNNIIYDLHWDEGPIWEHARCILVKPKQMDVNELALDTTPRDCLKWNQFDQTRLIAFMTTRLTHQDPAKLLHSIENACQGDPRRYVGGDHCQFRANQLSIWSSILCSKASIVCYSKSRLLTPLDESQLTQKEFLELLTPYPKVI